MVVGRHVVARHELRRQQTLADVRRPQHQDLQVQTGCEGHSLSDIRLLCWIFFEAKNSQNLIVATSRVKS